jgi:hypothetical protein
MDRQAVGRHTDTWVSHIRRRQELELTCVKKTTAIGLDFWHGWLFIHWGIKHEYPFTTMEKSQCQAYLE